MSPLAAIDEKRTSVPFALAAGLLTLFYLLEKSDIALPQSTFGLGVLLQDALALLARLPSAPITVTRGPGSPDPNSTLRRVIALAQAPVLRCARGIFGSTGRSRRRPSELLLNWALLRPPCCCANRARHFPPLSATRSR